MLKKWTDVLKKCSEVVRVVFLEVKFRVGRQTNVLKGTRPEVAGTAPLGHHVTHKFTSLFQTYSEIKTSCRREKTKFATRTLFKRPSLSLSPSQRTNGGKQCSLCV